MLPETTSVLELAWTMLASVGLYSAWWLWRDAVRSRHYWELQGMNGAVAITTRTSARSSAVRTLTQGVFLLVGLMSMSLPPRSQAIAEPHWILALPALGFIVVSVALVVDSILSRRDRERLVDMEVARNRREKAQQRVRGREAS